MIVCFSLFIIEFSPEEGVMLFESYVDAIDVLFGASPQETVFNWWNEVMKKLSKLYFPRTQTLLSCLKLYMHCQSFRRLRDNNLSENSENLEAEFDLKSVYYSRKWITRNIPISQHLIGAIIDIAHDHRRRFAESSSPMTIAESFSLSHHSHHHPYCPTHYL